MRDETASAPQRADWRERTVLVTGASGFLGQHLVALLVKRGARVIAQSRSQRAPRGDGVEWMKLDLRDADAVRAALRQRFARHRPRAADPRSRGRRGDQYHVGLP